MQMRSVTPSESLARTGSADTSVGVELRAAKIPVIGPIAWHHWFVLEQQGKRDRWEVWQAAGAGGESWGHLHRNLFPPERGVGNGDSWSVCRWDGTVARRLVERIEASPVTYPFCGFYWFWPGPNSNTYAQWVLGEQARLGPCAPGRRCALLATRWRRR
jgi:hypothetical protein